MLSAYKFCFLASGRDPSHRFSGRMPGWGTAVTGRGHGGGLSQGVSEEIKEKTLRKEEREEERVFWPGSEHAAGLISDGRGG